MLIKIDTTLERDMDLLIIEEFIANTGFAELFLSKIGIREYILVEAIHSKRDVEYGESDIVLLLEYQNKRHAIHIEDKIDASAMPNQPERYHSRAQKDISKGVYDEYSVFLVAPQKYIETNEPAQKYQFKVTYEELLEHFYTLEDPRYLYKIALIERAILNQKNGYQYQADERMSEFCGKLNEYKKDFFPFLPPLSTAWWPECSALVSGAKIVLKANKGHCDLQFARTTIEELNSCVAHKLKGRMYIAQAGKSASVRINVAPIDFEQTFSIYKNEVHCALEAIAELYNLSKEIALNL